MESVLDINGASNCEFANFRIEGDGKSEEVQNAIYFYWDKSGRTSAFCNFHDISILGTRCVTGFRIGKPGTSGQVDTSTYRNIPLYGNWSDQGENLVAARVLRRLGRVRQLPRPFVL